MDILEKFYSKIKGAYFAFLTLLAVGFGIFVALFIYLPVDPSFSIFSNYISDLGAGPIGSRIIFSIGMILGAVFLIFLILYISVYLKVKEEKYQLIFGYQASGIIAGLGLILIGIFPLDRANFSDFFMHVIGAVIFFSFITISNLYLGYIEYKNSEFSKIIGILSFICGILSAIFIGGFLIQESDLIEPQTFVYLSEWTFLLFITIWLIIHGLYFWRKNISENK
ncbi:MAG: DUF998 domain-containing protein [Promethearchaeota archaeon]|nr:MAG: DUF998 domain-containing protein [Candidatus Lokiarchaeota archaeon]